MKRLMLIAVLALACKDSTDPPAKALVRWTLSGATCTGGGDILFTVDGETVGTEFLTAGQASEEYPVDHGQRFIEARTVEPGYVWDTFFPVELDPGERFTRILDC